MRFSLLFPLLFLGVVSVSLAQGTYEDCCLRFTKELKPNVRKYVASYRRQEQDGGCNLPAIVFKTRRGKMLCARPEEKWAQELMKHIDKRLRWTKPDKSNKHGKGKP